MPYFGRWTTVEKGTACQGRSTVQFTHGGPRTAVVVVKGDRNHVHAGNRDYGKSTEGRNFALGWVGICPFHKW